MGKQMTSRQYLREYRFKIEKYNHSSPPSSLERNERSEGGLLKKSAHALYTLWKICVKGIVPLHHNHLVRR